LNIQAADNKRGVTLEGYYHLRNITSEIDVDGGVCLTDVHLVPEAFGPDGVPGPYPDDYPWPDFPLPDLPEFPPWGFPRWDANMVRNYFAFPPSYYVKTPVYQRTVINDPSSILPANSGAETMNALCATNSALEPEFVSDGVSIFFHQYDLVPTDYRPRIYRHDIETGASDYLELPNNRMDEGSLTVIDIGIVSAITWGASSETVTLHKVDFVAGTVTDVYSYNNVDINTTIGVNFCVTVQSTVNVYTVFDVIINNSISGDMEHVIFCRYNWTTGVSNESVIWENIIDAAFLYMFCAPVIIDYEIYAFYSSTCYGETRKSFIMHYNYSLSSHGYIELIYSTYSVQYLLKAAPYEDLNRIYFQATEGFEPWHDGHIYYIDVLTKELTHVDTFDISDVTLICNKTKCWRMDWSLESGNSKIIDLFTGEERWIGLSDSGEDRLRPIRSRLTWCVDDIDETVYTFLGGYIIGNKYVGDQLDYTQINETGITDDSGKSYRIMLLGRTFIVMQEGGTYDYESWVVHYPGSLVV
jgi:hypothetical protein